MNKEKLFNASSAILITLVNRTASIQCLQVRFHHPQVSCNEDAETIDSGLWSRRNEQSCCRTSRLWMSTPIPALLQCRFNMMAHWFSTA